MMTKDEAIKILQGIDRLIGDDFYSDTIEEAVNMAIEALEGVCFDEWCTGCKEYDTEKKCCPRFNKVIREALKRIPHDDGTLEVKVEDATKVGRVLISDDEHRGGLYYPDEDEPKGDLISRNEAFEVLAEILDENHVPIWICDKMAFALDAIPSADRPTDGDLISRQAATSIPIIPKEHRKVFRGEDDAFETGWNEALACVNMLPSADRPRGEWVNTAPPNRSDNIVCDKCGYDSIARYDYCPNCGADMRGKETDES